MSVLVIAFYIIAGSYIAQRAIKADPFCRDWDTGQVDLTPSIGVLFLIALAFWPLLFAVWSVGQFGRLFLWCSLSIFDSRKEEL